jgi:O-antigen/teichoic acid export membrane protein
MKAIQVISMSRLTSGRLLARNTLWMIAGNIASIVIALFSVPILVKYLGTDRFGIISLVWIVEGQFSLFDLGLSQALTKLVAEKLGASQEKDIPAIFWGSLAIMAVFGVIGSVILRSISPWLVHSALKVPVSIQAETLTAFHLVAISLPIVISSAGLRGLLSAHQRFDLLSMVRVPISLFSYLAPLLVLPFSRQLGPFVMVLVLSRFGAWIIHLILCFWVSPALRHRVTIQGAPFRYMLGFGGWMTVTNIVGPIMVNVDRILIGAIISMSAVAYYATPYEAATKLWIIPTAISGVLFPAFATALAQDRERAALLFERGVKYIFLSLFPIVLGVLVLGRSALGIWLGAAFAQKSTTVLQLLAIGIFVNSLAQVPFWQIQAANRPDLAAKVHLAELPCYLLLFWSLTKNYGIEGAGVAWMLRAIVDAVIMFWFSNRLLAESKPFTIRLLKMTLLATPVFLAALSIRSNTVAIVFLSVVYIVFMFVTWSRYLTPQERELVQNPMLLLSGFQPGRDSLGVSS